MASTVLDSASFSKSNSVRLMSITRDRSGNFTVSVDGVELLSATDNSHTTSIKEYLWLMGPTIERHWFIDYIYFVEDEEYPPTISAFDNWDDRLDIPCYGDVLLQSRELPELDPERRYGCRIGGVYYE